MGDSESRRMFAALLDDQAAGWRFTNNIGGATSRTDSSSQDVGEIFYNDVAKHWSAVPTRSPSRIISPMRDLAGHHNESLNTNRGSRSKFTIPEDLQGGFEHCLDTNNDERQKPWRGALPAHLHQPHHASSPTLFQHSFVSDRSLPPRYQQETLLEIPSTNAMAFYKQRKEMIARHHWKLTNQDMTFPNTQRCIRMLMKHHWKLVEFMANLEHEGKTERQLVDWLVREHRNLLDATNFVLTYFELCRMPHLRL